jgi:Lrp/AsnC family leucine-responsive transcriptional regulator
MAVRVKLDRVGRALVEALQADARMSYADLGRLVGMSPPAVAERVKRLEDAGLFKRFHAIVDHPKLGYPLTAFVRLRCGPDMFARVDELAIAAPEILECHQVTGEEAFIMRIVARSVAHLDDVLLRLAPLGVTSSAIVLSTRVEGKPLEPVDG